MKPALIVIFCACATVAGCGTTDSSTGSDDGGVVLNANGPGPSITVPDTPPPKEYSVKDLRVGSGPPAKVGDEVTIKYVTANWGNELFSNSWADPEAPTFELGAHELRGGLDRGIRGMKQGGRRELLVPVADRYFPTDDPVATTPDNSVVAVVDLLEIR